MLDFGTIFSRKLYLNMTRVYLKLLRIQPLIFLLKLLMMMMIVVLNFHRFSPQFVVIIVKKRINSRFFLKGNQGLSNPPPGTVVDTEATRPEWYV